MRAQSSITSGWCIIGLASCVRNVLAAHPPLQKPFATTARRTANPQGREAPMSHPHWHNSPLRCMRLILLNRNLDGGLKGYSGIPWDTLLGITPAPLACPWRRTRWRRCLLPTQHIPSPQSSCTQIRWPLPSTNLELHKTSTRDAELYKL